DKKRELDKKFTSDHPDMINVINTIDILKKKIVKSLNVYEVSLQKHIQDIKHEKKKLQKTLKTFPKKERKLIDYKREYEVYSKMYTYLLKLKVQKTVSFGAVKSNYKIVDKAFTDYSTKKPKPKLFIAVQFLIGIIMGISFIFLKELFRGSLINESSFELLGEIPHTKSKEVYTEVLNNPESNFSGAFRRIRNKFAQNFNKESEVIAVISENEEDGKTTVAINFASIFSLVAYRTILINLDLKKPMLHRYFTIDNRYGVSNYIKNECEIDDIIYPTLHDHLDMISAGSHSNNITDLLKSKKLNLLIEELKNRYDIIVLDTPSIQSSSDTLDILHLADEVLFVVKKDDYTYDKNDYLKKLIKTQKIKNLAIVLNNMKKSAMSNIYKSSFFNKTDNNKDDFSKLLKEEEYI
ncbi:MAG: hypothetical protein DSZ06_02555, partial [Sulfurospirillum sp.]